MDLTILRLLDGSRVFIQAVIDNASRYVLAHCVAQDYGGLRTRDLLVTALAKSQYHAIVPNVDCDSGSENLNGNVDSLVDSSEMTRTIAQIAVAFSNSMIEAFFRRLKHAWLFVHRLLLPIAKIRVIPCARTRGNQDLALRRLGAWQRNPFCVGCFRKTRSL